MENEKQFIQGFNSGFILAQYQMELFNSIINAVHSKPLYVQGMVEGKEQLKIEKDNEKLKELNKLREIGRSNERGLER